MSHAYCQYPPEIDSEVEVSTQVETGKTIYILGNPNVGRYIKLGQTEYNVLSLIQGRSIPEIASEFTRLYGAGLIVPTIIQFLSKLTQYNLLAGQGLSATASSQQLSRHAYLRFSLFNPDAFFGRIVPKIRWVWTPWFVIGTLLLKLWIFFLALQNWDELSTHTTRLTTDHYVLILVAGLIVIFSHEFAHGLTCKAFGGRSTEVGVLLIFYFLPALYCNVSGLHLIPQRNRRLWVIAAGVYWQLLVGAIALLCWLLLEPYTLLSDTALIFSLGSLLNIAFNANPLIKLDGYYFFSQALQLPNLMEKSRAYWRSLLQKITFNEGEQASVTTRQKWFYFFFAPLSLGYTILFLSVMLSYLNEYFVNNFNLAGFALTGGIAAVFMRRQIGKGAEVISTALLGKNTKPAVESEADSTSSESLTIPRVWKRRIALSLVLIGVVSALMIPFEASVGNYGTLTPMKEKESLISAPEAGMVTVLVNPGEMVEVGKELAKLSNPDLSSELMTLRSEIVRIEGDYERLTGDIKTRQQGTEKASAQLEAAARIDRELKLEQQRILKGKLGGAARDSDFPAALAILQADIDVKKSRLEEAQMQLSRAKQLYQESIVPKAELETAENKANVIRLEIEAAREKLQNAMVEHRRSVEKSTSEVRINETELQSAQSSVAKTSNELQSTKRLLDSLRQREQVLLSKQTSTTLTAPRTGIVLGENLLELNGKYLEKGGELCHIAETKQMRLRIQVPEKEIGDVKTGAAVRLKTRALPDQTFEGKVEKIGTEAEPDANKLLTYRVEIVISNLDQALKPGMTAFARIGFGRHSGGWIILHKIKQALRPELWLF
jgi:putative peptide zinc metalloprotease protein